ILQLELRQVPRAGRRAHATQRLARKEPRVAVVFVHAPVGFAEPGFVDRAKGPRERDHLEPRPLGLEDIGEGKRHGLLLLLLARDGGGRHESDPRRLQVSLGERDHLLVHLGIVEQTRRASPEQRGREREDDRAPAHPFSERFSTPSAASRITSDIEGCAWQMRAMSSEEAPNSIATTASAMSSLARLPMACTPRMRSLAASARILMKPSGSSRPRARPL